MGNQVQIKNKKAEYQYFLFDTFSAGLVLTGTEIKSIREGKVNLTDSYCMFKGDELFVINLHISEYTLGTHYNHEPKRDRKLLLNRRELKKLLTKIKEKGFTIIPVVLYVNEKGLAKIDIALAKGKKMFDKRESIKQKDTQREMDRERQH
ncbi:MAG: SsrA-binding protein SmpB [Bacteroidales bacterium]